MGNRATSTIWIGAKIDEYYEWLQDEDYDIKFNKTVEEILEINNLELNKIECSQELIGIGIIILDCDWDDGAKEFSIDNIIEKEKIIIPIVQQIFQIIGIKEEIKTYIVSDYS